jgi:hypothetical protein
MDAVSTDSLLTDGKADLQEFTFFRGVEHAEESPTS